MPTESLLIRNLSEDQKGVLTSNGIGWNEFEGGILLANANDSAKVAEALYTTIQFTTDTEYDGIMELVLGLEQDDTPGKIEWENFDGHHRERFEEAIKEIVLPKVNRNILADVPHGRARISVQENDFKIYFYSVPDV